MANITDTSPIDAIARRLASRVPLEAPKSRLKHLFFKALSEDARCARALSAAELSCAPEWVRRLGESAAAFTPHTEAIGELRTVARTVCATCAEHAYLSEAPSEALTAANKALRSEAGEFLDKIARMPLPIVAEKAAHFARVRASRLRSVKAHTPLFKSAQIFCAPGLMWRRIVSVGELGSVGEEFHNCLAKTAGQHRRYARSLREDTSRFWVLRNHAGDGLAVAMVNTATGLIIEARGPRNAPISQSDASMAALARASARWAPARPSPQHETLARLLHLRLARLPQGQAG